jgi:hypothetical protein
VARVPETIVPFSRRVEETSGATVVFGDDHRRALRRRNCLDRVELILGVGDDRLSRARG